MDRGDVLAFDIEDDCSLSCYPLIDPFAFSPNNLRAGRYRYELRNDKTQEIVWFSDSFRQDTVHLPFNISGFLTIVRY
jgi:hypothetical protein